MPHCPVCQEAGARGVVVSVARCVVLALGARQREKRGGVMGSGSGGGGGGSGGGVDSGGGNEGYSGGDIGCQGEEETDQETETAASE